ncbi:MAG: VOC family protein [Pirellulaceae bacterium]
MEPRISLITLGVRDLERSLRFYRDGLGLPTTWDTDKGVIFFQTSGVTLALYPLDALRTDAGPAYAETELATDHIFPGITLAHNVRERAEVDQLVAQAEAAGATIKKPPQETFWGGYAAYFTDPDGYLWEIAWGAFHIREDGSLVIP